jgi:lipoprotein NlpI
MTVEQTSTPKPPVGLILLLVVAGFFYALMLLALTDLGRGGGDAAGRGIDAGFGFLFGCAVWLLLGAALMIAGINGAMPVWAEIAIAVLWPLSGLAASVALDFVEHDRGGTAHYLLVPALLPPLIAAYALWARLPALQRKLPELPAGIVMLGAIALVSLAPMPRYVGEQMERSRERAAERAEARQEAAKEAERRRQNLERFQKLTADSPLWDWVPFFGKDSELDAQATAGAKALPHRQADAEEALRRGLGFPLVEYERLDLTATPAFCAAAGDFLQQEAAAHPAPSADAEYDEKLLPDVEADDISAIEWLTESCDIDDTVAQIRATIGSYKPTRSRDATLGLIAWRRGNGFYQHQRHDIDRAFQEYNAAVELSPEHPQYRKNRGDIYFDMGRYDEAIADYDEAVRFNPGYSEAYYSRGNAFDRKHDDERALASFDDAIRIAPGFAAAYNNRGLVYIRQGKLDLAIQDYDAALNRAPRFRLALDNRGRVRFFQGNYAGAAEDFAAALPLKPDEPYTVLLLYLARLHTGQNAREPLRSDAAKLDHDAWPYPVVAAWLGDKDAPAVQADARNGANPDRIGQTCEADFYFGDKALAEGDAAGARPLLEKALAGCPADYLELTLAKYELARLP